MAYLNIGDKAPEFNAKNQDGNDVNLADFKGKKVILFPDINGYEKWDLKAKEFSHMASFLISDLLERNATKKEREQGLDLADYLVKFNYREFGSSKSKKTVQPDKIKQPESVNWDNDIAAIEGYFKEKTFTQMPVRLNTFTKITDNYFCKYKNQKISISIIRIRPILAYL